MCTKNTAMATDILAGIDESQLKLLEEPCILIGSNDTPVKAVSKKDCHLLSNIEEGWLHFSLFTSTDPLQQ